MTQKQRVANLGKFRNRVARILVATDVAGRGLDLPKVPRTVMRPSLVVRRLALGAFLGVVCSSMSLQRRYARILSTEYVELVQSCL